MRSFILFLFCFFTLSAILNGQKVTVADEINIRNDYAYDILGQINENILLYRDQGKDQVVGIYDSNLRYKRERELKFEKNRVRIINITPHDSVFSVIYQYREKDTTYFHMREFDENVIVSDTFVLEKTVDKDLPRFFRYTDSEDRTKTVVFGIDNKDFLQLKVIDHQLNQLIWGAKIDLGEIDYDDDFRKIVVSNSGMVLLLFEKDNLRYRRENHVLTFFALNNGELLNKSIIDLSNRMTVDLHLNYNNQIGRVLITGLSHERKIDAVTDYFWVNKPVMAFQKSERPENMAFGMDFIAELYGKKVGKEKELKDFTIKDIILRQDGGFILVTEMDKDFSRRSVFSSPGTINRDRNYYSGARGWTDHYNEDVVVMAVKPDNTEHWRTILYKKQFSQDDGGVFSSFFIFKTPSRLKLIYNDEIKNNNTASEYILDPLGNYERNSLLSTDYQNLRLRFKDAVQISNNTLLVPSEKNYNLRLVKIEYSI